jgi:hypothetical protein
MLAAMHMQHGDNTSVTGNDTSEYWWWFQQGLCQGRRCRQHDHFATKGDLAEDSRLALSSDGDITTVGNFAKEGNVAMTSASAKRVLLLTMAFSATECSIANGVEGAKDGTLATDGDLAKGMRLRQGG